MKKILLTAGVAVGAALAGYIVWIYFIQPNAGQQAEIPPTTGQASFFGEETAAPEEEAVVSTAEVSRLKKISDELIFDYWFGPDGAIIAVTADGKILKMSAVGRGEKLSDQKIQDLTRVKPSPDGMKAIVSFGYPRRETFSVFNATDKSWQLLPTGTMAAAWRPETIAVGGAGITEVALLLADSKGGLKLVIYGLADKKSRDVIKINVQDGDINWPTGDEIYLSERPTADYPTSLWAINTRTKILRPVLREKAGLSVRWLDDGKNALKYSAGQLSLINNKGSDKAVLSIVTLPEKCAVNAAAFYCGVSNDFGFVKLPDDYYKNKNLSPDVIYRVTHGKENSPTVFYNTGTEGTTLDVWHPQIKENRLIFINRIDGKLYSLGL